jgi:phenylalanyl-tRNA synthetase alpha chain
MVEGEEGGLDAGRAAEELHPLERKVLPHLEEAHDIKSLVAASGLQKVEARRALQWLEAKGLVSVEKKERKVISLDENGKKYREYGLPEVIFLSTLNSAEGGRPLSVEELQSASGLEKEEVMVSLGILKSGSAIIFEGGKLSITGQGRAMLGEESPEQKFLKGHFPLDAERLAPEQKHAADAFAKRKKIILLEKIAELSFSLTDEGAGVLLALKDTEGGASDLIESLTPELLRSGAWKDGNGGEKKFRRYSINAPAPKLTGGRRHPLDLVIDRMRQIWLEMGFREMQGPWVETAFWCMDSMWIPQDHPAREMQDTFYLPYEGKLPGNFTRKVARVHENGGKSGSKGYGCRWDPELAKKLVLRTHTTAASFRKLGEFAEHPDGNGPPQKYFCIGRIFRNEAVDATHLPEFHQVEGFIMGKGLTLRDLMGYIREFYHRMGITRIKFRPTYNPYTEPSMEALGYNEQLGRWIELINSGMFRPESLEPYGVKVPVIAWGLGVERLAMMLYGREDIRDILGSSSDIEWLRNYKLVKE